MGYTLNGASDSVVTLDSNALAVSVQGGLTVGSNLAVDTNVLFVDTVGNHVGIGTTVIDITDHMISGAGNGLYIHNPVEGGHLLTLGTQRPWVFEQGLADASTQLNLRSLNSGKKFNFQSPDHSNVMTIVATNGGGNIGIGTTSPGTAIEIYGEGKDFTFKYDTGLTRQSAANRDSYYSAKENSIKRVGDRNIFDGSSFTPDTTHEILFGFSDTYTQWQTNDEYYPSYNEMRFKLWTPTNSTTGSLNDIMTLRSDGNVGIGLTSPAFILDVDGVSRSRGVVVNSSFNNNTARPALSSGTTHPSYEIRSLGGNGNVGSTGSDDGFLRLRAGGGTSTNNASYIDLSGYSVYSGNDMRRNIVFGTSGTERMRIRENGNVGIGVASPAYKLDIHDSTRASMRLKCNATSGDGDAILYIDSSQTGESDIDFMHDGALNWRLRTGDAAGTNFQIHGDDDAARFVVRQDGKVGIGETSPAYKLDVNGPVRTGNELYIGKNTNDETAKSIYFGGTYGDNNYDHCVIERRVWQSSTEKQELLLFSANDVGSGSGPDRIRLKGAEILFDTLNNSTDRTTENTKMKVTDTGVIVKQPGCRVGQTGSQHTYGAGSTNVIVYNSEFYDTGNDYSTSTGYFTCPLPGKYLCIHMMTARSSVTRTGISETKIFWNGSEVSRQFMDITQDSSTCTVIIDAATNDTFNAGIYNSQAANQYNGINEGGGCQFFVHFLG